MICKRCNREVADATKFCPYCGTRQVEASSNFDSMKNVSQPVYGNMQNPSENVSQPIYGNIQNPSENVSQPVYGNGQAPSESVDRPIYRNRQASSENVSQPVYEYGYTAGQNAGQSVYHYAQTPEQNAEQSIPYWERKPEKKSKRKLVIPCAILTLVFVVGCVAFAMKDTLLNLYHGQFSSDIECYRHVEETNRDEAVASFCDKYDKYLEQYKAGFEKRYLIKVELGEQLKSTVSAMGIDVSGLDSVTLAASTASKENIYDMVYDIQINDSDFVKVKLYADMENDKMYMQIPELSETYLDVSYIFDSYTEEEKGLIASREAYYSWLPTGDSLKKSMTTYSDIIFEGMDDASKSSDTLTASGVSQECTKISVSCDEAGLKDMAKKLLEAAKKDEAVNNLLNGIDEMGDTTSASEYVESLEETLKELEETDIDGSISMDVYVDDEGDIIGRIINMESQDDKVVLSFCKTVADGKIGVEYKATANGVDSLCFEGSGTFKEDAVTGDFTFAATGSDGNSVAVHVSTKDFKMLEDGAVSGTLSISTESVPGGFLDLTFAEEESVKSVKIGISYSGFKWGAVTLASDSGEEIESAKPGSDAKFCKVENQEEVQTYYEETEDNVYALLTRLSELTGIEEDTWYRMLGLEDTLVNSSSYSEIDDYDKADEEEDYEESEVSNLDFHVSDNNSNEENSQVQKKGSRYEYSTSGEVW